MVFIIQGMAFSTTVLIAVSLFVVSVWVFKTTARGWRNPLKGVPGPWYTKYTNLQLKLAVLTGRRIHYVQSLHNRYGSYVRIAPTEVSVADLEGFKQIHRINSGFTKSSWYGDIMRLPRPVMFTMTEANAHAMRRKLFARAFSKTQVREHWERLLTSKIHMAIDRIKADAESGTADLLKWFTLMTSDIATHVFFGESFSMIESGQITEYIRALQNAMVGGGIGFELPLVQAIGKHIPLQASQEIFASNNYILEKSKIAVKNSRRQQSTGGRLPNIFASIIQEAEKGDIIDDLDVQSEAIGQSIAGSDTTAATLSYLVWAILSRPTLQAELQKEVTMLPDGYEDADLENLPLLNAVINETLRLYGAGLAGLPRMVPSRGAKMGNHFLPEGTTVTTQAYTFHRDPRYFPDPKKFDESRWLPRYARSQSEEMKTAYHPFGIGSRICLGIHMAQMQLRITTAQFFRECQDARLCPSVTPASMELKDYFVIAPKSHKCEITLRK
ncbi:MAG: hypothetical protein M1820_002552 [Bogoriella megaspora]|nr:MAG: hypothetical protein M1820_002552 [Bogoriella megaspora]